MTKDQAAELAKDIGDIAEDLIMQLNSLRIKPTFIEQFYLGLLTRQRTVLRDVSVILTNNNEQQITSAFILFRVLLDDFIRLFSVYASEDMNEEIIKIQADAYNHRLKTIQESVDINNDFYNGQRLSLGTQKQLAAEKNAMLADPSFDKYFKDKANFKFKKLMPIAEVFDLMKNNVKTKANANSYVCYKFLTTYVHYSHSTFRLENYAATRQIEISQLEEILLYCYKTLLMIFEFLRRTHDLKWNDTKITNYFSVKTIGV